MTKALRFLAALLVAVSPLAAAPVRAQYQGQPQAQQRVYTQAELDQMLAPIALYPDALLSQILMAATYPIEVVQAARWTRANPGLTGETAVRAVQNEDWDPSVKSLVAFPQLLQRMDEKLDWTRALGDAFLAQEPQLMDEVQQLRRRAQAAGSLRSDERIRVEQQGPAIVLQPASPQYVYVPYYDPLVVYGPWPWPAYQPVIWAPWLGYARPYRPGVSVGFWWAGPVGLSLNFFFGDCDWQHRQVRVVHVNNYYYRPPVFVNRTLPAEHGHWQHDPLHRRGVEYRAAEVRQRFANAPVERRERRPVERRFERQSAPVAVPPQPAARIQAQPRVQPQVQTQVQVQPRADRREEREFARIEQREERQAARVHPVQAQARARQEQQARMPEAVAPPRPRALHEAQRAEPRGEHGPRGRERS